MNRQKAIAMYQSIHEALLEAGFTEGTVLTRLQNALDELEDLRGDQGGIVVQAVCPASANLLEALADEVLEDLDEDP